MSPLALLLVAGLALPPVQAPAQAPSTADADALAQAYFLFLQGHMLEGVNDLDGAIAVYRKALEVQPSAAGVRATLATLYARTGKANEAIAEALEALKLDPDNRTAHRVMGFVQAALAENTADEARQANLLKEAIGHFEKTLAGGVIDPGAQLSLGRLYVQSGNYAKGITTLSAFLLDQPGYTDGVMLLADAYDGAHRAGDAVSLLEPFVAAEPADMRARTRLAGLYEQAGRWKDAAAAWAELARRDPRNAGYRTRRAAALVNGGDFAAGRDELLVMAKDAPRDAAVWYLLSQAQRRAGDPAAAEESARHITDINPADPRGPLGIAQAKAARKDFRGAVDALAPLVASPTDALVRSGIFARAVAEMALALEGAGERDRALAALEDARRRVPGDDALVLSLAAAYERANRLDKAEAIFRDAIAKNPDDADVLNGLGYLLADHGQKLDDAVSLIKRALVIDADNPSYLDSLGWAYLKRSKPDEARPPLERAAAAMPNASVIHDHLGEMYFQLKRYKDAAVAWDRALAGDLEGMDVAAVTKKRDRARELGGR